jgi:hypothetical protein
MSFETQPVAGYASKSEAILALSEKGLTPAMIAEKIGSSPNAVVTRLGQLRRAKSPDAPRRNKGQRRERPALDTRGIWTAEKLEKAHRLFGKTMILIAEALEVPPKELVEYGLKGVIPPMGERQRVAQLVDQRQAPPDEEPPLSLPAPGEPTRDDDEAALAALEADDVNDPELAAAPEEARAMAPPRKYRIYDPAREGYLLRSKKAWGGRVNAWQGTAAQLEALLRERPELKDLDPERVP